MSEGTRTHLEATTLLALCYIRSNRIEQAKVLIDDVLDHVNNIKSDRRRRVGRHKQSHGAPTSPCTEGSGIIGLRCERPTHQGRRLTTRWSGRRLLRGFKIVALLPAPLSSQPLAHVLYEASRTLLYSPSSPLVPPLPIRQVPQRPTRKRLTRPGWWLTILHDGKSTLMVQQFTLEVV